MTDPIMTDTPVTQARLIYVRWSDDGEYIRKWALEPFEGATAFANAGNGAPLGPLDASEHYPVKDLPFALREVAHNIHVECADHVLEDMVRIVTDAADFIEARSSSTASSVEPTRVQKYLGDEAAARERLATFPDAVRQRLTDWQEGQSEWFSDTLLEVVAEFIAFDDAARSDVLANKAGGLWYRRWHAAQTRVGELESMLASPPEPTGDALRPGLERAAQWHDARCKGPDVFEQELHENSAKALRHLAANPDATDMQALEAAITTPPTPDRIGKDAVREALECAKIKLRRYMEVHGPDGLNPDTYVGGYQAEIEAVLKTIDAALTDTKGDRPMGDR